MAVQFAYPLVIAGIMDLATTSLDPGVRVVRGRDASSGTGSVVMVGVASFDANSGWDSAGTFEQDYQTFGSNRVEAGSVNVLAYSCNGELDADAACTAVFQLIVDLAAAVRADQTLGLTDFDYLITKVETGDVMESSNEDGAAATLSCVIHYQARI